jgi:hypothetical protein
MAEYRTMDKVRNHSNSKVEIGALEFEEDEFQKECKILEQLKN